MNTVQSTLSSPRNQRVLFWIGMLALAAGIVVLIVKLTGGSDPTPVAPSKGFKPQLPTTSKPLLNGNGVAITQYDELPGEVKTSIRRFVVGAVAGQNYRDSWNVLAPVFKKGYTQKTWVKAPAHPVVPFPVYNYEKSKFTVAEATTKEILVDMKVSPTPSSQMRQTRFRIGLIPSKTGKDWLVNYWMPLWTPPLAYSGNG